MPNAQLRAYRGRVVTMDAADTVLADGIVYVRGNRIAAVTKASAAPPPEFAAAVPVNTHGTLYPGLIELHNHLSYDALKLWQVPKLYANRDDWPRHADYRRLITGPMKVLGTTKGYSEAVVRYVECKCLLGGVTASQGMTLSSNKGIVRYYRGLVRNVETANGADMPAADAKIADVVASDANKFLAHLNASSCLLLHLSEGTDDRAHKHFEALALPDGRVAITDALAGIHCVALKQRDFQLLGQHGGSMVWSPLSNLLLYGRTADVKAAKQAGVTIGLGSDWSPSGSKNLLGELKVARVYSQLENGIFSDKEIVAMATRNAARILKWDKVAGSLEPGKYADLIAVHGKAGDPYGHLIAASEADIELVVIDGVPRCGTPALMSGSAAHLESWKVGGKARTLDLGGTDVDPIVAKLSLAEAADRLTHGLANLKQLALDLEQPKPAIRAAATDAEPRWFLELEHEEPGETSLRPRFAGREGTPQKIGAMLAAAATKPLSQLLGPLELDPITVADDPQFVAALKTQPNLPAAIKNGLSTLFA